MYSQDIFIDVHKDTSKMIFQQKKKKKVTNFKVVVYLHVKIFVAINHDIIKKILNDIGKWSR